jgi:hypothetical protein
MLVVMGQEVLKHKTKELKSSPTQPLTTGLDIFLFLKRRGTPTMISFPNCFPGKEFRHFKTQRQSMNLLFQLGKFFIDCSLFCVSKTSNLFYFSKETKYHIWVDILQGPGFNPVDTCSPSKGVSCQCGLYKGSQISTLTFSNTTTTTVKNATTKKKTTKKVKKTTKKVKKTTTNKRTTKKKAKKTTKRPKKTTTRFCKGQHFHKHCKHHHHSHERN